MKEAMRDIWNAWKWIFEHLWRFAVNFVENRQIFSKNCWEFSNAQFFLCHCGGIFIRNKPLVFLTESEKQTVWVSETFPLMRLETLKYENHISSMGVVHSKCQTRDNFSNGQGKPKLRLTKRLYEKKT